MKRLSGLIILSLLLSLVSACGTGETGSTPLPAPSATVPAPEPTLTPEPAVIDQVIKIAGHQMPLSCRGQGEPTIILENGSGGEPWDAVSLHRFESLGRVCTYQRIGLSDPAPGVRTASDQVQDLQELLSLAGIPGPYILVGHAMAGLNLILFADQYPDQVAGLVCIECLPPQFRSRLLAAFDTLSEDEPEWFRQFRLEWTEGLDWSTTKEMIDTFTSLDQALQVEDLGAIPLVVLVAGDEITWNDPWIQIYAETWLAAQLALSELSANSRLEIVLDVNHQTIVDSEAVDRAVEDVYREAALNNR